MRRRTRPQAMMLILLLVVCASSAIYFANRGSVENKAIQKLGDKGVVTQLHKSPRVWEYHYETHDYILTSYGGIIHSESCQCKETGY